MKYYWETHEHCTLGLCRFVKIPFQISWKLHSHIGLKEQTQSFPTLCKGGVAKTKKTSNKTKNTKIKKNIFRESWLGVPPSRESGNIVCFFFRCFFLGFAPPRCKCVGKDGFRSYGSAAFVLMVLFFSRMGVQFMESNRGIFFWKNGLPGASVLFFFWGGPTSYTCISRKALPPIYLYI